MAKRRSVMLGIGALATGSGAVFTSGALAGTTTAPGADLRVISDGRVTVRGYAQGDSDVYDLDTSPNENIDFSNINRPDLPRATFANTPDSSGTNGNINGDVQLTVAIETNQDDSFAELLKIDNNTDFDQDVAIHFEDDENGAGDPNDETYGSDVGTGSDQVSRDTVQTIYQFRADTTDDGSGDTLISPEPNAVGVGGSDVDDSNTGANKVTITSGNTLDVYLDYNTNDGNVIGEINSAAGGSTEEPPFGRGGGEDVDLLDEIVVEAEEL